MGTPTTIEVSVDATEYSRYEKGRETITASLVVAGGAPYTAETILIDLVKDRRGRDAVVATGVIELNGTTDPQEATATFFLPNIVDQDLIHLVRHGKYFVRASSLTDEAILGESATFDISIITVDRLKADYLFGIDLTATEIRAPKFPPSQVTGVTIAQTSKTHPLGFCSLVYNTHIDDVLSAIALIGAGVDGTVSITGVGANGGAPGNSLTVEVVVPAGTSSLSATSTSGAIVVSLAVIAGVPDNAANTATLVAAALDALTGIDAVALGLGMAPLTVAEGPTQFCGGLTNTLRYLSWCGGPTVNITAAGTYVLKAGSPTLSKLGTGSSSDYICITVKSLLLLPLADVAEEILMGKKTLEDETLRRYIDEATSWVENDFLATHVEPTNVVTDRDPTTVQYAAGVNAPTPIFTDTDFDFMVSPLTYFVPRSQGSWVQIQTPHPNILRVDSLFGAIANTRVIDIDLEWIELSEKGGLVQLVPFNQEIAFDFVGLLWVNAIRGATELPNFWRYNAIVGLRDAPAEIRELIAKKAAINALIVAGMALRPGVGSVSLSRDGVSESVSYTTTAQYGIYTGTISAYKDWIKERGRELRAKYRGMTMVVV